jgi:RimJ/RimL family protein N-acetyltransferase
MSDPLSTSWLSLVWWIKRTYPLAYCIELDAHRIGFVGLYRLRPGKSASLSLAIFDEAYRNRGYGTRTLGLFVQHLQKCRLVERLAVDVMQESSAASRFWEKAGFREASAVGGVITMTRDLKS